jgi:hypothetical protein
MAKTNDKKVKSGKAAHPKEGPAARSARLFPRQDSQPRRPQSPEDRRFSALLRIAGNAIRSRPSDPSVT